MSTNPAEPQTEATSTPAQETDWKAEARKWEQRAKENSAAQKRLAELEEASKTELQKALERAEAAEKKVAGFETRDQVAAWAKDIVKDSPVPADALRGTTQEELQAHFEQLKALIPTSEQQPTQKGAVGPYVPTEGTTPANPALTPGQQFATFLQSQMQG